MSPGLLAEVEELVGPKVAAVIAACPKCSVRSYFCTYHDGYMDGWVDRGAEDKP